MKQSAQSQLAKLFQRNGCFRLPNSIRRKREAQGYKKGYEVRLIANDKVELLRINSLLKKVGFKAGKPFPKGSQLVQPIYGKDAVERFRDLLAVSNKKKPLRSKLRRGEG